MTKRRPSWSDIARWAAAFACSLLLCQASSTVWAAGKKASAKPAAARQAKKAARKHASHTAHPERVSEFGPAALIDEDGQSLHGQASFYGKGFHGRKTSTGERFDIKQLTAASNRFPMGTLVAVRRLDNDRCVVVKVNDRMHDRHRQRVIDVSHSAAEFLGMLRAGVVFVRVAPLKDNRVTPGADSCLAAFEPGIPCVTCLEPPPSQPGLVPFGAN